MGIPSLPHALLPLPPQLLAPLLSPHSAASHPSCMGHPPGHSLSPPLRHGCSLSHLLQHSTALGSLWATTASPHTSQLSAHRTVLCHLLKAEQGLWDVADRAPGVEETSATSMQQLQPCWVLRHGLGVGWRNKMLRAAPAALGCGSCWRRSVPLGVLGRERPGMGLPALGRLARPHQRLHDSTMLMAGTRMFPSQGSQTPPGAAGALSTRQSGMDGAGVLKQLVSGVGR